MLFICEWRKLWRTRYLQILTLLLLIGNVMLCMYQVKQTQKEQLVPNDLKAQVYADYAKDPVRIERLYAEAHAEAQAQQEWAQEMMASMMSVEVPPLSRTYSEEIDDYTLFRTFFREQERIKEHSNNIDAVVITARRNQDTMRTFSRDDQSVMHTYAYRYQEKIATTYQKVRQQQIELTPAYTNGWDIFLDYRFGDYLLVLLLFAVAGIAVLGEKGSGFYPLLCTTPRGFRQTMAAKIAVALVTVVGSVFLFDLTAWITVALANGFAGMNQPLQLLVEYTYCPYSLQIWQYALLQSACKALAMTALICGLLLASAATYRFSVTYSVGAVAVVGNFLLQLFGASTGWTQLNFFSFMDSTAFFKRFQVAAVGEQAVSLLSLAMGIYALIALASIGGAVLVAGGRKSAGYDRVKTNRFSFSLALPRFTRSRCGKTSSIGYYEFKKLFTPSITVLVLLLVVVKCITSSMAFQADTSYGDEVYKEYTEKWSGPLSAERERVIADEQARLRETIDGQMAKYIAFVNGEISSQEYYQTLEKYTYANSRIEHLNRLSAQVTYLHDTQDRTGVTGWIIYDTGWLRFLERPFDSVLLLLIVLLLFRVFVSEYTTRGGEYPFSVILRSTLRGRRTTYLCKLKWTLICTVVSFLFFTAIDVYFAVSSFEFSDMSATLISMERYGALHSDITVGEYVALFMVLRFVGIVMVAMQVFSLSQLLKKPLLILIALITIAAVPGALATLGLTAFQYADQTLILSGDALVRLSAEAGLLGDFGLMALVLLGFGLGTAGLMMMSYRQFTGGAR